MSKLNLDPILTSDDNLKELLESIETDYDDNLKELSENTEDTLKLLLESIETDYDDNLKELSENTDDTLKLLEEIDPSFLKPSKEIKTIKALPTNKNWYI